MEKSHYQEKVGGKARLMHSMKCSIGSIVHWAGIKLQKANLRWSLEGPESLSTQLHAQLRQSPERQ